MKKSRLGMIGRTFPIPLQKIFANTVYPFIIPYYLGGHSYILNYNFLKKSQWWSKEELIDYQLVMLRNIINYSYEKVPYYHKLFQSLNLNPKSIKDFEDLEKIPILTKEDVFKNYKRLLPQDINLKKLIIKHTSGTTGKPLTVYFDKNSWGLRIAAIERARTYAGLKYTQKKIEMKGTLIKYAISGTKIIYEHDALQKTLRLNTGFLNDEVLNKYSQLIQEFKPEYIEGFPTPVFLLARHMKEKNECIDLKAVLVHSEPLLPPQKKVIEESFNCKTFNRYDLDEGVTSAAECEKHKGLHIDLEKGVIEIVKDGKTQNYKKSGKIIVTGLYNLAFPLIRYDTGDIATISKKECLCGRSSDIISSLEGRETDTILTTEEDIILPAPALSYILKSCTNLGIKETQFIQTEKNILKVKIIKRKNYTIYSEKILKRKLNNYFGNKLKLDLEYVNFIPREKSGKFKLFISEIKNSVY